MKEVSTASPLLSVVVPFRDEENALLPLLDELVAVLEADGVAFEALFVDDASRDEGPARIEARARSDARLRLLRLSPHSGQSAALEAGFRLARGDVIATLDGDGQNDPADLPTLLGALSDSDCVCGIRVDRHDSWARRVASRLANRIRSRLLGDGVSDIGCSLRVMRSSYLHRIKLFRGGHRFLPSMLRFEGARVTERPVRHRARRFGESKYSILGRLGVVWVDLLAMLWLARRVDRYDVKELSRPRE